MEAHGSIITPTCGQQECAGREQLCPITPAKWQPHLDLNGRGELGRHSVVQ